MPKYIPKPDDIYETTPCFVCGQDVLDEGAETCSDFCRQQKQIFDDDWEWFLLRQFVDEMEEIEGDTEWEQREI